MDITLVKGAPQDLGARLEKEKRTYRFLDSLGIEYYTVDNPPADTMEDCAAIEQVLGAPICKNLFLCNRQRTLFYLLMIPSDKIFKTKDISAQINSSRLSFAPGEDMEELLDITPGSVSVLGLMNDKDKGVSLLIDRELLSYDEIGVHPCVNTSCVRIRTDDIINRIVPATDHTFIAVDLPTYSEQEQ